MKFSTAFTALLVGSAAAAPLDARSEDVSLDTSETHALGKRVIDPITMSILTAAAGSVASIAVTEAYGAIKGQAKTLANWDSAREAFTKEVVAKMWAKRKNDGEAAVCYNMAYDVSKPNQVRDKVSVDFKSGSLKTDYDCFWMSGPDNHFWSRGDGGFINLAIMHNSKYCTFDKKSSDLYCK